MENKIFDYRTILEGAIGNKLQGLLAPKQKFSGLLDFATSNYGGDIGKGLLAQSQYTAMPTNLGANIGTAVSGADQLRTQRRANEFSELGAFADVLGTLTPKGSETDDSWKFIQSYAKGRGIELSETEAKEVTRNVGKGNVIRIDESTGTQINTLDILLEPYFNRNKKNIEEKIDPISLETGEKELKEENINKKVKVIADDFSKNNWNESIAVVQEVESILSKKGNIKGIGPLEGTIIPYVFIGEEGRKNRAVLAKLFNITLKDRSGAAVTLPELERLKEEFNAGGFKTDEDYRNAFGVFKRILNQTIQQAAIGYDPEAFSEWQNRGGIFQIGNKKNLEDKYL